MNHIPSAEIDALDRSRAALGAILDGADPRRVKQCRCRGCGARTMWLPDEPSREYCNECEERAFVARPRDEDQ